MLFHWIIDQHFNSSIQSGQVLVHFVDLLLQWVTYTMAQTLPHSLMQQGPPPDRSHQKDSALQVRP